jgi:hypothetical protein
MDNALIYVSRLFEAQLKNSGIKVSHKTRNRGEQAEDLITAMGATPSKTKGAIDHTFGVRKRKLGDKAWPGHTPSILNARRAECKIDPPLNDSQLKKIQNLKSGDYKYDRIGEIIKMGSMLHFVRFDNSDFQQGLSELIDKDFPSHLGQAIIDWRQNRPTKSLVINKWSTQSSIYSQQEMENHWCNFLFNVLIQHIKPNGVCGETIDDMCFIDKHGTKIFFNLSDPMHLQLILAALRQNAYFDGPKEDRYPPEISHDTIYLAFQVRLNYHRNFSKGMSEKEYIDFANLEIK